MFHNFNILITLNAFSNERLKKRVKINKKYSWFLLNDYIFCCSF